MKFWLDGIQVYFPYPYIYPEQYNYMLNLKRTLDSQGPCVLEMPSGTGKTVSLLSLITSYQFHQSQRSQLGQSSIGKLIYCSRTIPEIEKTVEELKRVIAYRSSELGPSPPRFLGLALSSRKNLCINEKVRYERDGKSCDSKCRDLTASWVRHAAATDRTIETCGFFEGFNTEGRDAFLNGVYTLEDLRVLGKERGWCPYFLARHLVNHADVIVYSYQYLIDPKISDLISKELKGDCVVVFDEAHNIDNVCIEALSVNLNRPILESASRNLLKLSQVINDAKQSDQQRLRAEYDRLVEGLAQTGISRVAADHLRADPVLPDDIAKEVVPGNIRRAEHFVGLMRRFAEYLKVLSIPFVRLTITQTRLRTQAIQMESPLEFLQALNQVLLVEPRTLRFCSTRLSSLLTSLEVRDAADYVPISLVADFATLLGTYSKGFRILIEPYDERYPNVPDPIIQFSCLDASIAMAPIIRKFKNVIITSGTISPLHIYPRILNFTPIISESFPMTLTRRCVSPLIVTRGSDQVAISSKYDLRNDPAVVRNYGALLVELSAYVPDGIVCFFTSYSYMEGIVVLWNEMGILSQLLKNKLLFVETPDQIESSIALENYKKACDSGRGAILFSVARGKVSEGVDFDHHYGRAVVMIGIPYVYTESRILRARLEYLRDNYQIRESEFLAFDAMRVAAQCVGRIIRGKSDYGLMVFADKRYARADKKDKMPAWIRSMVTDQQTNLSTDMAIHLTREFLKQMAQPWSKEEQLGTSLWSLEHVLRQPTSRAPQDANGAHTVPAGQIPAAAQVPTAAAPPAPVPAPMDT